MKNLYYPIYKQQRQLSFMFLFCCWYIDIFYFIFSFRTNHFFNPDNALDKCMFHQTYIYHTRLRTKCSSLKQHLFSKNMIQNPLCECGIVETTKQFLLECPRFTQARTVMINTLLPFCILSLNILLYRDDKLDFHQNKLIFLTIQHFISESKHFTSD